jgi:N-acyl-D-amino-acid deacylase
MNSYDLLIKNGNVIDGKGNPDPYIPWVKADVAVSKDKIVKVGHIDADQAKEVIDATDFIVSPGFIDIHSHSDGYLFENPKAESTVHQGITTVGVGNCGMSAAPISAEFRPSKSIMPDKLEWDWVTMGDYLKKLEQKGISVNVVPLVGHSNVRGVVMGYKTGKPSKVELEKMKDVLQKAMHDGAWGMSSGLIYPTGSFSDQEEMAELCKVVRERGGVYHTHIRGQGETMIAATLEAFEVARKSGIPLHIHHHKGMGDANAPKVMFTLSMVDDAVADGMDITLDMYPYLAGQGGLALFLPPWVHEGGPRALIERLKDGKLRGRMIREMTEPSLVPGYQSYVRDLGWQQCWGKVIICECSVEKNKGLAGKSLAQAKPDWQNPFDFIFDLLVEENGDLPVVIPDVMDLDDTYLQMVLRHPMTMIGSDGYALAPYGILGQGKPHPRSYGAFPRILGVYVREKKLFTWQEAVRKMTSLPARFLGIRDRGLIAEGMHADIVIFDPVNVIDCATFSDPHQYPKGIEYVITNGAIVTKKGEHTGALAGRVLRHR